MFEPITDKFGYEIVHGDMVWFIRNGELLQGEFAGVNDNGAAIIVIDENTATFVKPVDVFLGNRYMENFPEEFL